MATFEPQAFAFSPAHAAQFAGLGLTRIKALLSIGALPFHKDGRRTLILRADLESYLVSLKTASMPLPRGERGRFAATTNTHQ